MTNNNEHDLSNAIVAGSGGEFSGIRDNNEATAAGMVNQAGSLNAAADPWEALPEIQSPLAQTANQGKG